MSDVVTDGAREAVRTEVEVSSGLRLQPVRLAVGLCASLARSGIVSSLCSAV